MNFVSKSQKSTRSKLIQFFEVGQEAEEIKMKIKKVLTMRFSPSIQIPNAATFEKLHCDCVLKLPQDI